jgi:hypothetical protein
MAAQCGMVIPGIAPGLVPWNSSMELPRFSRLESARRAAMWKNRFHLPFRLMGPTLRSGAPLPMRTKGAQ